MGVPETASLATLRCQQVVCLEALLQVSRDLRDAVVAGALGAILDSASEHEHLVAKLDQMEREIQLMPSGAEGPDEAADLARMQVRGVALVQELSSLLAENQLLLRRTQERSAFRLYLLTGNDRAHSMVDRRA